MILVACEISQTLTIEFRKLGFEAYSADIESIYDDPPVGGDPKWHIQGNVLSILSLAKWKMVIAFPPCTHLCVSGAKHFRKKRVLGLQQQGIDFFLEFTRCKSNFVAIENPIGIMSNLYRKPDQIIQPYEYGEPYRKSTCLWLKNLPKLIPTNPINCGDWNPWTTRLV
jgi:hypothetical protein